MKHVFWLCTIDLDLNSRPPFLADATALGFPPPKALQCERVKRRVCKLAFTNTVKLTEVIEHVPILMSIIHYLVTFLFSFLFLFLLLLLLLLVLVLVLVLVLCLVFLCDV